MDEKVVVERDVVVRDGDGGGNGTGSNAVWAIAFVVIVAIIVGALYYSGALKRFTSPQQQRQVNVEVSAP
ncbi:MAG: hypothetical protein ABI791_07240 [Acidobacteriota bacterium]